MAPTRLAPLLRGLTLSVALAVSATAAAAPGGPVGSVLPAAPVVAPGRVAPTPPDPLAVAIEARSQGDLRKAAWAYEAWLAEKGGRGRTRAAVNIALGLVYLELDEPNLASALFSKARASGTPVAAWGQWYEALADHERGRHQAAASGCASYRKRYPEGAYVDECLVLMGDAYVAAGKRGPAIGAYSEYLEKHPDSPREEPIRLGIALAVSNTDPAQGIPMLQGLLLDHAYHSTGETAQRRLDELAKAGFDTALPKDGITECRIAAERKRCGYEEEAWSRFQALAARAGEDPAIDAWIESHADDFRWGTKQYDAVAEVLATRLKERPSADVAWQRYRAQARGGDWKGAVAQLQDGAKAYPSSRFRGAREELARAQLLAGDYAGARETWTQLGKGGGAFGKEARWLAAFAAFRLGDDVDALSRLEAIDDGDDWTASAARYYRIRTLRRMGQTAAADTAAAALIAAEPWSWYAALLQNEAPALPTEVARNGRWPGPKPPSLPPLSRPTTAGPAVAAPAIGTAASAAAPRWEALRWQGSQGPAAAGVVDPAPATPVTVARLEAHAGRNWDERPQSYRPGVHYDPQAGGAILEKLAADHPTVFKDAQAAADLARAGAFDLAAELVAKMYDAIDPNVGGTPNPDVKLTAADWRQVFLFVRDHYHVARFSYGLHKGISDPEQRTLTWRLNFPTAQADALWRHGQRYDVDPFLALGLMRQESVYRQWALSPVGAIGLMQVMPRTGARIAARMGDTTYSPDMLQDPSTNVRYGMWYLSQLLDRFGGAWPLAVASYNGGPHNVSSWLRPWGDTIRTDDFVEQIPYAETRDYVKKVTGWKMAYLALYGTPDDKVRIPMTITRDDPSTVNF